MDDQENLSSSSSEDELQPLSPHGKVNTSKQLQYYYRRTKDKRKRKYTPFIDQENPSRQLKRYHATVARSSGVSMDSAASETTSDNYDNCEVGTSYDSSLHNSEDEDATLDATSSTDESEESSSFSEDDSSQSSTESENFEEPEEVNLQQENETSQSQEEEPLYQGSKISKILSFVLIVSFVLKHNLSKAAWADLLRMLTALLGERCQKTFQSVYKMKLFMKEYFGSKEPTKINYCSNCLKQVKDRCPNDSCKGAALSSFLDLHFEEKIKDLFRDSEFLTLLKKGKEQVKCAVSSCGIHDIFHGMDYKNFLHPGGFLSQLYNISFTVNTDGVNKFSSSRAGHLWPVYVMINELPKEHRFKRKFLIPAYIYCDKKDPNMLTFLNPLIEKLNSLNDPGIHVPDSAHGNINVRCMLFVATADLPARADLMNMKFYNGKCACHLCISEGKGYGPNNIHRYWPFQQNLEKRTHDDQLSYASNATQKKAVMGVKGHSVFAKLLYPFDLIRSFAIDWMHCVCLGVVKYIMQLQMSDGNRAKPFYLGAKKESISRQLQSIKPPDIVGRLPRSLEDLKHWKATELKNWLLHYSVAVLRNKLNPLYAFHWSLLVGAIGILCSDSISTEDLRHADSMLQDFVLLMGILYGPTQCTMNIHLLQHLAYYVSRRGPLWAYSCFAFESMNAFIKPLVHGTHHAKEQIGCAIGLCFGLANYTKTVLQKSNISRNSKRLLQSLSGYARSSRIFARVNGGFLCGKDTRSLVDDNIRTLVRLYVMKNNLPLDYEIVPYLRFESNDGQKFYSLSTKTRKTNSTVVEYTDKDGAIYYGRVKLFLKLNERGICICNALEESSEQLSFNARDCDKNVQSLIVSEQDKGSVRDVLEKYHNQHLVKHHVNIKPRVGKTLVISVEQIRRKCVFIDILTNVWIISRFPNIIEHN